MRAPLRRALFMVLLAALLIGGLVFAFWPQPHPVDLAVIERGPLRVTVDGEGQTRVRDVYVVSSPLAGRITRIDLRPGDPVEARRTVVTSLEEMDPAFLDQRTRARLEAELQAADAAFALARAELERTQAELDFARSELRRAEALRPQEAITERALDQARLNVRINEARVATAQATLRMRQHELESARAALIQPGEGVAGVEGLTDGAEGLGGPMLASERCCVAIRSPVSGRVLRVLRESEGVVPAGEPLIEIGDPTDLEIVVDLPSSDAVRIREGAAVVIDAWGGEEPLAGRVRRVEPFGFTKISALGIEEQRVNVVIDLLDAPEARAALGHGYRVLARVVVYAADDVLRVPMGALFRDGAAWATFVHEDGRARLRRVEIGPGDGRVAEVRAGLAEGEEVVLHPSDQIADGVRITRRMVQ
jgi:HlyD family secretion protein